MDTRLKRFILVITLGFLFNFLMVGCMSYREFPVSKKVPAAEIDVGLGIDKYENHIIRIRTKYLVSPDRLDPKKKFYVVWVETKNNGVVNVGRLYTASNKRSTLKTLVPFHPKEVFITAEEKPLLTIPKGIEICRIDLIDDEKEAGHN